MPIKKEIIYPIFLECSSLAEDPILKNISQHNCHNSEYLEGSFWFYSFSLSVLNENRVLFLFSSQEKITTIIEPAAAWLYNIILFNCGQNDLLEEIISIA